MASSGAMFIGKAGRGLVKGSRVVTRSAMASLSESLGISVDSLSAELRAGAAGTMRSVMAQRAADTGDAFITGGSGRSPEVTAELATLKGQYEKLMIDLAKAREGFDNVANAPVYVRQKAQDAILAIQREIDQVQFRGMDLTLPVPPNSPQSAARSELRSLKQSRDTLNSELIIARRNLTDRGVAYGQAQKMQVQQLILSLERRLADINRRESEIKDAV